MWKITIKTDRDETLTIFVAGDAFNGIVPAMDDNEKMVILQNYAARMIRNLRKSAPQVRLPAEPIYLESINYADAHATIIQYLHPTPETIVRQKATFEFLRADRTALAKSPYIQNWNLKWRDEFDPEVMLLKRNILFAQQEPPIAAEDSMPALQPPHGNQLKQERKRILKDLLIKLDYKTDDDKSPDDIADEITDFSRSTLSAIKDFYLSNTPDISRIRELDETIDKQCGFVRQNRSYVYLDNAINSYITTEFFYQQILENIASALHNAVRDYYKAQWQLHCGNMIKLEEARKAINEIFRGIAYIEQDFVLQPVSATYQQLLQMNLDKAALEKLISDLLNATYKHNGLFEIVADRLNALQYFEPITRKTLLSHAATFAENSEAHATVTRFEHCRNELRDIPAGCIASIRSDIQQSKDEVEHRTKEIYTELYPNAAPPDSTFWQRNKATIISLCAGAAIAVGVGVAIALAPITLPTLVIAGIIAGAAALIIGAATIIGRIIDKCVRAPQDRVPSTRVEQQRLLDDYDRQLDTARPTKKPGKPVEFPAEQSALRSNSLLGRRSESRSTILTAPEYAGSTPKL